MCPLTSSAERRTSASAGPESPARAQIHVDAARQAGIEAAHRAHDVDPLEVVRAVLLEDRRVLHRVFVGAGHAVAVAGTGVPAGRRIGMIVGDLAVADHDVMRQHAAHRLVESAADGVLRHLVFGRRLAAGRRGLRRAPSRRNRAPRRPRRPENRSAPGPRSSVLLQRGIFHSNSTSGRLTVLGKIDLHARAGRLHVADVDFAGQGRRPEPGQRAAAGVERQHFAASACRASGAT